MQARAAFRRQKKGRALRPALSSLQRLNRGIAENQPLASGTATNLVASAVFIATAWWTASAGRALSSMVATRGRDIERLMQAVEPLRRLFGFVRASIIVVAVGLVCVAAVIVWCTMSGDKGGRCPVGWW